MYDIVYSKNEKDQEKFVKMAIKLGYLGLIFVVDKMPKETQKYPIETSFILKKDIVKTTEKVRHYIESKKIKLIYGIENHKEKDYMKQRNSQLNQVLCKIMYKKDVMYGLSINDLFEDNFVKILPRIIQNLKLCKKYKVKVFIGSFATNSYQMKDYNNIISFFNLLNFNPGYIKECLNQKNII